MVSLFRRLGNRKSEVALADEHTTPTPSINEVAEEKSTPTSTNPSTPSPTTNATATMASGGLQANAALEDASEAYLNDLLTLLRSHLDGIPSNPPADLSIIHIMERSVGIGNRRGMARRGIFDAVSLRGERIEIVIRFQFWGASAAAVDDAIIQLQQRLLDARNDLWANRVLKINVEATTSAEFVGVPGWRKTTDYRILYEFHYEDNDGAGGLITRVPVSPWLEAELPGDQEESLIVTGQVVNWNDQRAPALIVKPETGQVIQITRLGVLATQAAIVSGSAVTIQVRQGASVSEQIFTSFEDFWVTLPPQNEQISFTEREFEARTMFFGGEMPHINFPNPIVLAGSQDEFSVRYGDANTGVPDIVMYLKYQ